MKDRVKENRILGADEVKIVVSVLLLANVLTVLKILVNQQEGLMSNPITILVLKYVGIFFILYGVFFIGYEKLSGLPFFYGHSQSAGSNANGSVIVAIGIAMISRKLTTSLVLSIALILIIMGVRYKCGLILENRLKLKGSTGIAVSEIKRRGKIIIDNKKYGVRNNDQIAINAGQKVKVSDIQNMKIFVRINKG
ncbi:MAG TPA: NfeD family protein [Candidatus Dorea intestinavium]|nr:NfeD family protein [Candidatus Dorea intestinavium]